MRGFDTIEVPIPVAFKLIEMVLPFVTLIKRRSENFPASRKNAVTSSFIDWLEFISPEIGCTVQGEFFLFLFAKIKEQIVERSFAMLRNNFKTQFYKQ